MSIIDTTGGAIGFDSAGGGDAVPILFLHGVGSDRSAWAPQLTYFGAERRAIAIDWPGYGESTPRPATGPDDFATAALDALDALQVERAHICGLSLGGVVALAMGSIAPARCASLILADSFAMHPEGKAIFDRSLAASKAMTMAELAAARAPALLASTASARLYAEVIATMSRIDPDAYRTAAAVVWLADQRRRAAALRIATSVLVGEQDRITPPSLSAEVAALIPNATCNIIADAGHLANLEQPESFNALVDRFLARVEAAPAKSFE